ncbi:MULTISPECIES: TetR family transcriptional regulator [unclassified Streptomyces]|uniref:TetR family transcriptional regulator n=1 Tax=unclassified Streptomyces TaxID=2593676 RepID=UPI000B83AC23|nr:TetR family transcriptional regulator [Streptomyces sp. ScaeMP-e83]MYR98525.1 TetR family transcriptional regulator [Streptomyces sp. SID4937]
MNAPMGLRERKKQRTRETISDTAIALFLEHGFDQVSVVDIAAVAEVSKPTLFRYFPTKEDLVVHRFADHQGASSAVVAGRPPGVSPLAALHQHFLDGLAARDPITGLNDDEEVLAFHRLVYSTPSLVARVGEYLAQAEETLARALADALDSVREITPALLAGQVIATERILASVNWRRIVAGRSADELYPEAVADADHAYALLSHYPAGAAPPK